ncbi:MAG: folylpolyglutamate synthase/dihydrofolate synthase family protein [Bacillota bacterium]
MDYKEALDYLHSLYRFGSRLGLERVTRLLELAGRPQDQVRAVHIAGTNGKGSVTSMVASILQAAGYRTGMYISPYLERFTERAGIGNEEIPKDTVARLVGQLIPLIERMVAEGHEHPTEFEVVTAMAFLYFAQEKTDLVALEVGLGGRFDATNTVNSLVSVITNISFDHMERLGNTLPQIAYEKAGIIKERGVVVTGATGAALDVIAGVAREKGAQITIVGRDVTWEEVSSAHTGQVINVRTQRREYLGLELSLLGRHQQANAATAVAAVECLALAGYQVSPRAIFAGLKAAAWPGRLEIMRRDPLVILDGAHNADGARVLALALRDVIPHQRLFLVLGLLGDKCSRDILAELVPLATEVVVTRPLSPRALPPERLAEEVAVLGCPAVVEEDIGRAVDVALSRAGRADAVCVAGSLYLVGHARSHLKRGR